jgi:hypothetical protein
VGNVYCLRQLLGKAYSIQAAGVFKLFSIQEAECKPIQYAGIWGDNYPVYKKLFSIQVRNVNYTLYRKLGCELSGVHDVFQYT